MPARTGWATPHYAQDSQYVVAVRNYSPEDGSWLSFHKGDIIHLQPLEHPERGERPPHTKTPSMGGTGAARPTASRALGVAVRWPRIL